MFPRTSLFTVVFLFLTQLTDAVRAGEDQTMLFDFSKPDAAKQWQTVNDGVMGGVSEGKVRITEKNLEFTARSRWRTTGALHPFVPKRPRWTYPSTMGWSSRSVEMAGILPQCPCPQYQIAFSYRASFKTEKDKWTEVTIPFTDLKATSFGRIVEKAKPLDASNVEAVGFLLADKKAGPFKLDVAWIKGTPKAGK